MSALAIVAQQQIPPSGQTAIEKALELERARQANELLQAELERARLANDLLRTELALARLAREVHQAEGGGAEAVG